MKVLILGSTLFVGSVGAAFAADAMPMVMSNIPAAAAVPPPAPSSTWGGLYIGVFGGWALGTGDEFRIDPPGYRYSADVNGPVGGAVIGLRAAPGLMLFGAELDAWVGRVVGQTDPQQANVCSSPCYYDIYTANWGGHLRGLVGFGSSRFAAFIAGGVAIAPWNYTSYLVSTDLPAPGSAGLGETWLHIGASLGAGVEAALGENASFRAEYVFDRYFSQDYFGVVSMSYNTHTVRVGLVLHREL